MRARKTKIQFQTGFQQPNQVCKKTGIIISIKSRSGINIPIKKPKATIVCSVQTRAIQRSLNLASDDRNQGVYQM